jgi:glyoxylase-like metal-dependent hydrolase (beta-lactamase superfamily II)
VRDAHTDGDAMIHFKGSDVLHTGDAFVHETYPFIDAANGGSLEGYKQGLATILQTVTDRTKIIPGHGPLATKEDVSELLELLETVEKKVDYLYRNEKSEDEVAKMTDLTEVYDRKGYGDGFISREKLLRTVYQEIAKARGPIDKRSMEERLKAKIKAQKEKNGGR